VADFRLSKERLAEIASEMVRLKAQHYGKGPLEARAFQNDEVVICVLKGGITTVERTLLEAGEERLVRDVRMRFQERMADTFRDSIERVSGRRVLTYASQILFDPDYIVEIAVLGEPLPPPETWSATMGAAAASDEVEGVFSFGACGYQIVIRAPRALPLCPMCQARLWQPAHDQGAGPLADARDWAPPVRPGSRDVASRG
jgi:uncharacterized protein YbcI